MFFSIPLGASFGYLMGGLTAGVTGAYARAIGIVGQSGGRYLLQDHTLRGVYQSERPSGADFESESNSGSADRQ